MQINLAIECVKNKNYLLQAFGQDFNTSQSDASQQLGGRHRRHSPVSLNPLRESSTTATLRATSFPANDEAMDQAKLLNALSQTEQDSPDNNAERARANNRTDLKIKIQDNLQLTGMQFYPSPSICAQKASRFHDKLNKLILRQTQLGGSTQYAVAKLPIMIIQQKPVTPLSKMSPFTKQRTISCQRASKPKQPPSTQRVVDSSRIHNYNRSRFYDKIDNPFSLANDFLSTNNIVDLMTDNPQPNHLLIRSIQLQQLGQKKNEVQVSLSP